MKRLLTALAASAALLFGAAAPADAYNANRVVVSDCYTGKIRTWWYGHENTRNRMTSWPCPDWTVWVPEKQTFFTYHRPVQDLQAAQQSANIWWPKCKPQGYSGAWAEGNRQWFTWFHVCI